MNQYLNSNYSAYPQLMQSQLFPPQQIPTANGKASIDNIKLAPNSSVLIADSTQPIIWRCVSDSLGNVTSVAFDIVPHKDEEQVKKEQMELIVADLAQRIERLENEQSNTSRHQSTNEKYGSNKTDDANGKERKQSTGNGKSDA